MSSSSEIRFSSDYLWTVFGQLKIACSVFALISFLFVQHSKHGLDHSERFFIAVTLIAVCSTGILLALYLFRIVYVFNTIPWLKIEFYYCLIATLLFALSTLLLTSALLSKGFYLLIGTCFGYAAMCGYGYDAFLKYNIHDTAANMITITTLA